MGKKKKKGNKKPVPGSLPKKSPGVSQPEPPQELTPEDFNSLERQAVADFLSKEYSNSVLVRTRIIALAFGTRSALLPKLYKVFTDRGVSNLYLQNFSSAVEDCCYALALQPRCLRAYVTRAFANFYLQRFPQAFEDYELARNLTIARKALTGVLEQYRSAAEPPKLEWLGDFGLLSVPYQDEDDDLNIRVSARPAEKESNWRTEGTTQLPLLIPVGDSASEILPYLNVKSVANKVAVAMKEKDQGNAAYAACEYPKAVTHYTRAIKLNPRGLVYLKMQRYYDSISDCTASLDRKPSIKAYARRAAAWAALKEYFLAAEDYRAALKFESRNQDCLTELEKCLRQIARTCQQKLAQDPESRDSVAALLTTTLEDLQRIHVASGDDCRPAKKVGKVNS